MGMGFKVEELKSLKVAELKFLAYPPLAPPLERLGEGLRIILPITYLLHALAVKVALNAFLWSFLEFFFYQFELHHLHVFW